MSAFLDQQYFDWLYSHVCSVRATAPEDSYRELLHILYTKEFVWLVPNDDNRVEDGKELRHEFLVEEGIRLTPKDREWMELGCSVLELLVALSHRLAFETDGRVKTWFWELLSNLELNELNDKVDISRDEVENVIDRLIWRTYHYNGGGGLFPLVYPEEDQRKVELWYQASAYLIEQGDI